MIDSVVIEVEGGKGGDGLVSSAREAMNPRGGPDGGAGGNGGTVIVYADQAESTLYKFRRHRVFRAHAGGRGGPNKRRGANGDHVRIGVPVGTEVWDEDLGEMVVDLSSHGDSVAAAAAGRGGAGNSRFVSSVNQYPLLAEVGEQGVRRRIRLELKLLADVGLVGMPNAGKSSILAALSAARPKVASYPFTTIEPVLGVVEMGLDAFVMVDVPGLIEGAHEGAGLGDEFLKHAERTRLLVHVVDGSMEDLPGRVATIDRELEQYGSVLGGLPKLLAVNKMDLLGDGERRSRLEEELVGSISRGTEVCYVSAITREGLGGLVGRIGRYLAVQADGGPPPLHAETGLPVLRPASVDERTQAVREAEGVYRIVHPRAVRLAMGSNLKDWSTRVQYHAVLDRLGVNKALGTLGVGKGDTVLVGDWDFQWG